MIRRLTAAIATMVAAALLGALPAPAATPKSPPPPKQFAAAGIDAHLGYMWQTTCTPSAKPGTTALLKLLIKTYGGSSSGISRGCSVGGTSEHKEGRALDWRRDVKYASHRRSVDRALKWLTANNGEVAYRLGVMYIIWNQRIWSIYYPELGWRKMASRGSYTANHKNHVHISLSWDGAMKQTSWWTGVPITSPLNSKCGVKGARACLPTIARNAKLSWPFQKTEVPASFMPYPWTIPNIGGSPQVDRTLTAVPGTWVPEGAELSYQWTADSRTIPGATQETFVVTPAQLGRAIRVKVSATTPDGRTVTKTSPAMTDALKARFTTAPKPKIVGKVATDQVVTVEPGKWAAEPSSLTFTWKRNGKTIKGFSSVSATSYRPKSSDVGAKLSVTVTARRAGYETKSVASASVKVTKAVFATAPPPVVSGDPIVGGVLRVDAGEWSPRPRSLGYQWYADGKAISKATRSTFTLTRSQLGKKVYVRVRATRPGYTTAQVRSKPVLVVPAG